MKLYALIFGIAFVKINYNELCAMGGQSSSCRWHFLSAQTFCCSAVSDMGTRRHLQQKMLVQLIDEQRKYGFDELNTECEPQSGHVRRPLKSPPPTKISEQYFLSAFCNKFIHSF
jgi:hypothetical protein